MQSKSYFYFNLHKKCWSQMVRGKVVDHVQSAILWDVEFRVRPAGRARVLLEGRKNVHAFAVAGKACACAAGSMQPGGDWIEVVYNPYDAPTFRQRFTGKPIYRAARVILTDDRKVYAQLSSNLK